MAMFINEHVGKNYLKMLMTLGNLGVGQVTVKHEPFPEIIERIDNGDIEGAVKMFSQIFGKHRGGHEKYVPATKVQESPDGIPYAEIWGEDMAEITAQQIISMEYSPENIRRVCEDMVAFGRAFQERTIDAVKVYDKVVIPYADDCDNIRTLFRADDPVIKMAWTSHDVENSKSFYYKRKKADSFFQADFQLSGKEGGFFRTYIQHIDYMKNVAPKGQKPHIKLMVADNFHKLQLDCIRLAGQYAKKAMGYNPSLFQNKERNMMTWIGQRILTDPAFAAMAYICLFYKENLFRSLSSLQTNELKNARKLFKREQLREQERGIKARYRVAYKEIGNILKMYAVQLGFYSSNYSNGSSMLARAAVWASFYTRKNGELMLVNDRVASNFADCVLEREFAGLMYDNMLKAGEKVATEAVAPLFSCLVEDGEVLEFVENEAWSQDGATLLAEVEGEETIPDGKYRIRWNEKGTKAFAVKSIRGKDGKGDVFAGEPVDNTKFAFMLSFKEDGYDYEKLVKVLSTGKEITLLPWKPGMKEKNMVVVDGQVMATYRSFNFAYSGVVPNSPDYAAHKTATQKEVTAAENKICGGRTGKVSAVFSGLANGGKVVVILMEDVKSINPKDVKVTVPEKKKAAAPAAAGSFQLNMAGLTSTLKSVEVSVLNIADEVSKVSTVTPASIKKADSEQVELSAPFKVESVSSIGEKRGLAVHKLVPDCDTIYQPKVEDVPAVVLTAAKALFKKEKASAYTLQPCTVCFMFDKNEVMYIAWGAWWIGQDGCEYETWLDAITGKEMSEKECGFSFVNPLFPYVYADDVNSKMM